MTLRVLNHSVTTVPWKSVPNVSLLFNILVIFFSSNNYGLIEFHLLKIICIFCTFLSMSVTVFLIRFEFLRIKDHDALIPWLLLSKNVKKTLIVFLLTKRSSFYFPNMASRILLRACHPRALPYSCSVSLTTVLWPPPLWSNPSFQMFFHQFVASTASRIWEFLLGYCRMHHIKESITKWECHPSWSTDRTGRERHVETLKANTGGWHSSYPLRFY